MNEEQLKERFENYYKLPNIILELMNWLCTTKFYKKTYEKRYDAAYVEDKKYIRDWMFCDFVVDQGTLEKPLVIRIGEIPNYKGDYEKTICINFSIKEACYIRRGYATGLYASKIIVNKYDIPKYMKEDLYKFIDQYNSLEGENYE